MKLNPFVLLLAFCALALGMVAVRNQMSTHAAMAETSRDTGKATVLAAKSQPRPAVDPALQGRTAYLRMEDNGHYWTNARINGATIRLMVDSGASVVALTARDAQRLHIDTSALVFDKEMSTAGGRVRAAAVVLDEIVIDRVKVANVQAVVLNEGLETSLLGMSFLSRLTSWQATPRAISIRQ